MKLELTKIEAVTLEDAYTKASEQLECSITDLEFEIVQNPSKGFLGFGKKLAIIVAARKVTIQSGDKYREPKDKKEKYHKPEDKRQQSVQEKPVAPSQTENDELIADSQTQNVEIKSSKRADAHFDKKFSGIENSFFVEKMEILDICTEVQNELNRLFEESCFKLDKILVTKEDEQTILIKISGEDSALMIGKEGYRYNAMAYLLFNWINPKYKIGVKLEIAEFLQNQEEVVKKYIETVIMQVNSSGQARTKPLDGVLLQIAIKELRAKFPEKYVGVKTSDNGTKFIVINEFSRKNSNA